ncbi:MAG: hypothetical protein [Circular genetic element sp.]|nr:MAG: hypothetical protein [Circular genetic element sp.]
MRSSGVGHFLSHYRVRYAIFSEKFSYFGVEFIIVVICGKHKTSSPGSFYWTGRIRHCRCTHHRYSLVSKNGQVDVMALFYTFGHECSFQSWPQLN